MISADDATDIERALLNALRPAQRVLLTLEAKGMAEMLRRPEDAPCSDVFDRQTYGKGEGA